MATGEFSGILLPDQPTWQFLLQYTDGTAFMIEGNEQGFSNLVSLLSHFGLASGVTINWDKNVANWFSPQLPPTWLNSFQFQWGADRVFS
jgi:hypothetical protein